MRDLTSRTINRWRLPFNRVVKRAGEWESIVRVLSRTLVLERSDKMHKTCACINILKCKHAFYLSFIIDFTIFQKCLHVDYCSSDTKYFIKNNKIDCLSPVMTINSYQQTLLQSNNVEILTMSFRFILSFIIIILSPKYARTIYNF